MTICFGHHPRNHAIASTVLLICASLVSIPVTAIHAQAPTDNANGLLDSLKKRSPEERWQRVKKQYSVDSAAPRRSAPPRVSDGLLKGLSQNELPPSPGQVELIPRLTALPVDTPNDWVLPARDPVALLEELALEPVLKPAEQVNVQSVDPQPVRNDASAPSVAGPNDGMKADPAGDVIVGESRPPTERKIADINPYYDRDRDSDIREFAIVKGREFGLQFKHKSYVDRSFPEVVLPWDASNYFFHPLYFSDPALERYGHSYSPVIQPLMSIARFGTQFILLPYQMTIDPPFSEQYPLGWYRPGDCTPKLHYQIPLNAEAAAVEAGVITGLFFLIP